MAITRQGAQGEYVFGNQSKPRQRHSGYHLAGGARWFFFGNQSKPSWWLSQSWWPSRGRGCKVKTILAINQCQGWSRYQLNIFFSLKFGFHFNRNTRMSSGSKEIQAFQKNSVLSFAEPLKRHICIFGNLHIWKCTFAQVPRQPVRDCGWFCFELS